MRADVLSRLDDLLEALADEDDEPRAINVDGWRHAVGFLAGSGIVSRPGISVTYEGHPYFQWHDGGRLMGMAIKPGGEIVWATTSPAASGNAHVSDFDLGTVAQWVFEI